MDDNVATSELFNVGSSLEGMNDEEVQKLYQELLVKSQANGDAKPTMPYNSVKPTPGRCVKTRNVKTKEKVFINICTSSTIPTPNSISEEDLIKILENLDDPDQIVDYKIPMSVGGAHAEIDNRGNGCTAYDVVISPNFLHTILNSKVFFGFFMSVVFEALLNKYEVELERNWTLLKTKKFLGKIDEQNVRTQRLIQEVPSSQKPLITEVQNTVCKKPNFEIVCEPEVDPDFLVADINLPGISSAKAITLDIGEDRIVLNTRPQMYQLDIFLPYNLKQDECGSQFHVQSHVLTITMPIAK